MADLYLATKSEETITHHLNLVHGFSILIVIINSIMQQASHIIKIVLMAVLKCYIDLT